MSGNNGASAPATTVGRVYEPTESELHLFRSALTKMQPQSQALISQGFRVRAFQTIAIARVVHDLNISYKNNFNLQPKGVSWTLTPEHTRLSIIEGVIAGLTTGRSDPRSSHDQWMSYKLRAGWTYGPELNHDNKQHPSLLPWHELPEAEQLKDLLFVSVVLALRALAVEVIPQNEKLSLEAQALERAAS